MPQTNQLQQLTRIGDLLDPNIANGSSSNISYTNPNYSGIITAANTPQDLASANSKRDRLTIQNLGDSFDLLIAIDIDAQPGNSFVIRPGGAILLEKGEADKRISIYSAQAGLKFTAVGRVEN